MFSLKDQVAIVTGGANGIGKGIVSVLAKAGAQGEAYLKEMAESIPVKSLGEPEDIGHAACFLASPEARFITGQTIIVDGGQILPESFEAIL